MRGSGPRAAPSGGRGPVQLEQVVGEADERPLAAYLFEPAEQELAKAPCLLDLSEGWFSHGLASCVFLSALVGHELALHSLLWSHRLRWTISHLGWLRSVLFAFHRNVGVDAEPGGTRQVVFGEIAGVGGHVAWHAPAV